MNLLLKIVSSHTVNSHLSPAPLNNNSSQFAPKRERSIFDGPSDEPTLMEMLEPEDSLMAATMPLGQPSMNDIFQATRNGQQAR